MANYYVEVTTVVDYATDGGRDIGFVPIGYRLALQSGGPVQYSFDGSADHGELGPSGTLPMEVQIDGGGGSKIWLKGSGEVVSVWAWD